MTRARTCISAPLSRPGGSASSTGRALHLESALDLYDVASQTLRHVEALGELATVEGRSGQRDMQLQHLDEALALLKGLPASEATDALTALLEVRVARTLLFGIESEGALEHADRGLRLAERAQLWDVLAAGSRPGAEPWRHSAGASRAKPS